MIKIRLIALDVDGTLVKRGVGLLEIYTYHISLSFLPDALSKIYTTYQK